MIIQLFPSPHVYMKRVIDKYVYICVYLITRQINREIGMDVDIDIAEDNA